MTIAKSEVVSVPASAGATEISRHQSATAKAAAKVARLEAQVQAARQNRRAALERQAAIVGRAVIAELPKSAEFRRAAIDVLRRRVTRPVDRAEISVLLIDPALNGGARHE